MDCFIDDLCTSGPFKLFLALRGSTWILFWGPLLFLRHFRTFAGLTQEERMAFLVWLSHHPVYLLREMPQTVKMIACLGYCGMPTVQEQIGLPMIDPEPPAWARE